MHPLFLGGLAVVLLLLLLALQCALLRGCMVCLREANAQLRCIRNECSTYAIERRLFSLRRSAR
jgi:hypothetical protein